ncbi:hypothetical protein NUU61_001769 [Penicillium alfredii]|uniref:Chorismate mutase domain-containing protein n=1 Tax=Penicillium alfredii TaxID=1506179 RepID=A0A9W9FQX6_9EURO|nr:uncharacterized protein NUU61_001769 [Penicillium alfredii]KAJ5104422.1 hypothetical protein NUU61_001769 [Penicillium alfredii]
MLMQEVLSLLPLLPLVAAPVIKPSSVDSCYGTTLPSLAPSTDHRLVPWRFPSVHFSALNGTLSTCCESLNEIRTVLDQIDDQLLDLLNRRAAYVREATRFKSTRASVNMPSRNQAVVQQAEQRAIHIGMPVIIARAAMGAVLNGSVLFEQCILRNLTAVVYLF